MSTEPDRRPRPQYGEYADAAGETPGAPLGDSQEASGPQAAPAANVAQNEGVNDGQSESATSPTPAAQAPAPAPGFAPGPVNAPPSTGNRLPGVPHNLGVSRGGSGNGNAAARPAASPAGQAPQHGEPYRASDDPRHSQHQTQAQHPAAVQPAAQAPVGAAITGAPARNRGADRIITIALLVLGAYGALNWGYTMLQLRAQTELAATMFGLDDFVAPAQIGTFGTVGALISLALYAVVLIFSIQRMRAKKLAFWVPLAAGALSIIIMTAITMIAFSQSPELVQALSQPDAMDKLLQYLQEQSV